mmetsp:Transcript_15629/g.11009  ORF Transcript_15629/g.11009 Transcript_15629/m.11009 type:complete len:106 (-) Transcript_15629:623-940(-)
MLSDYKESKHQFEKEELFERLRDDNFEQMKYFLDCGFNLLVFGAGSKRTLLNTFVSEVIHDQPTFIVNGYHTGTNLKSLVISLCKFITENIENKNVTKKFSSIQD